VLEKYPEDVRLVIKHFPLRNHKFARNASTAALAAHKQGKFWEFNHKLFENMASLSDKKVDEIAGELGLDTDKFKNDLKDREIQNLISRDTREGSSAGVRGTPTLFINGKRVSDRSFEGLQKMIESALAKKK